MMVRRARLLSETEISIALLCQLFSTCYTAVRIKNCLKSTSVIKVATMENTDDFSYAKEAIMCNHQINAFTVSKDKRSAKVDTGKSQKNALDVLWYTKGTSQAEVTLNREKIKPVALAIIELCWSEGIRQLVSRKLH